MFLTREIHNFLQRSSSIICCEVCPSNPLQQCHSHRFGNEDGDSKGKVQDDIKNQSLKWNPQGNRKVGRTKSI